MTTEQLAEFRKRVEANVEHWTGQATAPIVDIGSAVAQTCAAAKLEAYRNVLAIFDHVAAGSPCRSPNGRADGHMAYVKMGGGKIVCAFCGKGNGKLPSKRSNPPRPSDR